MKSSLYKSPKYKTCGVLKQKKTDVNVVNEKGAVDINLDSTNIIVANPSVSNLIDKEEVILNQYEKTTVHHKLGTNKNKLGKNKKEIVTNEIEKQKLETNELDDNKKKIINKNNEKKPTIPTINVKKYTDIIHEINVKNQNPQSPKIITIEDSSNNNSPLVNEDIAQITPMFLQEPFLTVDLILNNDCIEKLNELNGDKWLTTNLLDFLIKYGLPLWKTDDILVPTSAINNLLEIYNNKAKSTAGKDKIFVRDKRNIYKHYTTKPYRIIVINCHKGHFFVISMIFDATDAEGDYFQYINIYDSLKRSFRKNTKNVVHNSSAVEF